MNILILEPYDGGSHKQFLDQLSTHSRHTFTRLSMPARKWKWRMRGSAIYFVRQLEKSPPCDLKQINLIFTSDMTAITDLKALLPDHLKNIPIACFFHENQLTYPLPDESQRDYQYGFTNITSCLAADAVWFNSNYHLQSFLTAADKLLKKMPDFVPQGIIDSIQKRSKVMPLGLSPDLFNLTSTKTHKTPPAILWNHRWEYDKNPDEFFETLFDLDHAKIDFRLFIAGQNFRNAPPIFHAAHKSLAHRIDHFGYLPDRSEYLKLLARADIVVSTAIHEFFGLSVLEAIAAKCFPLLPNRLSYPELLPTQTHNDHLYNKTSELRKKLSCLCQNPIPPLAEILSNHLKALAWPNLAPHYDLAFENILTKKQMLP